MKSFLARRHLLELVGGFLAAALVAAGVWFVVQRADRDGTAQPPAGQPPATSPVTPPTTRRRRRRRR